VATVPVETTVQQEAAAALVRPSAASMAPPDGIGGVEKFTVHNVHDFARRLLEQVVTIQEAPTA
jgi:hypothetical protein